MHPDVSLVLEGACGTGKTSLARSLSAQLGVPIYRPFRGSAEHIEPRYVADMQDLGLSINDWQEDVYVADVLANLKPQAILDRSMLSALTWNAQRNEPIDQRSRRRVLRLWTERMVAWGATLVLVTCNDQTRRMRSPNRGGSWEAAGLAQVATEVGSLAPMMPIWSVSTDVATAETLATALAVRITHGASSPLITNF